MGWVVVEDSHHEDCPSRWHRLVQLGDDRAAAAEAVAVVAAAVEVLRMRLSTAVPGDLEHHRSVGAHQSVQEQDLEAGVQCFGLGAEVAAWP